MTKQEAIGKMREGIIMTHETFQPDEWVTSNPQGDVYEFEDGIKLPAAEFWKYRRNDFWQNGWDFYTNIDSND